MRIPVPYLPLLVRSDAARVVVRRAISGHVGASLKVVDANNAISRQFGSALHDTCPSKTGFVGFFNVSGEVGPTKLALLP
jgi:hypothetical protein